MVLELFGTLCFHRYYYLNVWNSLELSLGLENFRKMASIDITSKCFKRSLMLLIQGVTIPSFHPDRMHCKHLGIDKHLLGSVLYVLVHYILPGTVEENLEVVWRDIESVYQVYNTENRYGHMRQTMFHAKSQPKLKGKASEVRDLGPVMVSVFEKHMNHNLLIHRQILIVLQGSLLLVFQLLYKLNWGCWLWITYNYL